MTVLITANFLIPKCTRIYNDDVRQLRARLIKKVRRRRDTDTDGKSRAAFIAKKNLNPRYSYPSP